MAKRKRKPNYIGDYLGASVGIGVTGSVVGSIPNAPAGVSQGVTTFSSFLPAVGTVYGASMLIDATKGLTKRRRKK